jgi:outer membrane protein TolC
LSQLRTAVQESNRAARVSENATLPNVSLQMNYSQAVAGSALPNTQQQWSVSVQGSSDLFHGAEKSTAEQARIKSEALQMELSYKASGISRQIQQQVLDIGAAKDRIALREAQISEAEGKLALAKVKFSNDMADNFEIVESETELQRAQVSLLESKMSYALGIYELKAVSGHLLDGYN